MYRSVRPVEADPFEPPARVKVAVAFLAGTGSTGSWSVSIVNSHGSSMKALTLKSTLIGPVIVMLAPSFV